MGLSSSSLAQVPSFPSPIFPPPLPSPEQVPERLPPPGELLRPPTELPPLPTEPDLPEDAETVTVRAFQVEGSTVFTPEELAAATAPFVNRPITFTELLQARTAITQLYIDKGYITSGAFIPAGQVISEGVVIIQVIEGRLAAVEVTGLRRLSPRYIRDRITLQVRAPLNVNQVLVALQMLQLDPLVERLSAELVAGLQPGESVLAITAEEAQAFRTQVVLDNARPESIGSFQRQVQFEHLNLLGYGDALRVAYANTDGSHQFSGGYRLPINARNGTLEVTYEQTWSQVIEPEVFRLIDLKGQARSLHLTYRQPVIQTPRQELALGLGVARRESETTILGEPFPISPGSDDQGKTRLTELKFFQDWLQRHSNSVLALRSEFNFGLGLGATTNPTPPDGHFFLWRTQAQWVRELAPDTLLVLRANAQVSDRPLPSLEQFGLGGADSVRGYPQDLQLADMGVFGSAEARFPLYRMPQGEGVLQVIPFLDIGKGWNRGNQGQVDANPLLAVGVGLRWNWRDRITARVDWGIPLLSVGEQSGGIDESRILFSIVGRPF
nr:ShlB/FhaC/HecB family hemolysin secretion/activation protein [Petrachloros mirabilis]